MGFNRLDLSKLLNIKLPTASTTRKVQVNNLIGLICNVETIPNESPLGFGYIAISI